MARGEYKDVKFVDFSGGLNTKINSNFINDNESPDLQNVVFDGKGHFKPRLGCTIFGVATSATGKIRRTWTTVNSSDEEVPLRQIDNSTTAWMEYYNYKTSAWENLDSGYTTGYDFGNAYYDYYTYYCSQQDYQRRWDAIINKTSTYADSAYSSLMLSGANSLSALGFLSAGSVVVDGEESYYRNGIVWGVSTYADSAYHRVWMTSAVSTMGALSAGYITIDAEQIYYSSISSLSSGILSGMTFTGYHTEGTSATLSYGNVLSGMTFTTAHNGGTAIATLPTSTGDSMALDGGWVSASNLIPKGSIMYEMDAQMFVAGCSGLYGNTVYYSAVDEPTNWKVSTAGSVGTGGEAKYPETTGGIRAMTDFDGILTVLKQNTIRRLKFNDLADGTSGTLEIVQRTNVLTAPKVGAINNKGLTNAENDVIFISPTGWVKNLTNTDAGTKTTELSLNIRPTVEGLDFTRSASIYYDGKLYVACGTAGSTYNNLVYVYDTAFSAWTKFIGWNVNDWFIYDNNLYFGASNEIATYKALVNYDDNGSPYQVYYNTKQFDFGIPNEQKRFGMLYVEGYILPNAKIGVSAYFDGGTMSPVCKTIDGSDSDYVSPTESITTLGYNTWGKGIYGGTTGSSFTLRKFRWWGRYSGKNFYNLQVKLGSGKEGYAYEVTHVIPYLLTIPGKKIPINSIN